MRKKNGIALMVLGCALFFFLIGLIIGGSYWQWSNNWDGFQYKYDSLLDMIYSREKGSFLLSLAAAFILALPGFLLFRKNPASE